MNTASNNASARLILIHGTAGHPCIHWLPWLRLEIEKIGIECKVPWMPTPEGQHLKTWWDTFNDEVGTVRSDDILVGHSVGATFVMRVLERTKKPVKASFLVSAFDGKLPDPEINRLTSSFIYDPFDWNKIRANAGQLFQYHGIDDPYVPIEIAKGISDRADSKLKIYKNGGHLNSDSGFTEFHDLLDDIKSVI